MSTNLRDFQTEINDLVREGGSIIKPDARDRALFIAVERLSKDKPRTVKVDISTDGTTYNYPIATHITDWVRGFSWIKSIEFPAGYQNPTYLEPEDYTVYEDADEAQYIKFSAITPASGYTMRIEYTIPWSVSADSSTIEDKDSYAISCLAGSICLRELAAHFAQTSEPSLDIDVIDYARKPIEYNTLADTLENIYRDHLGIPRIGARGPVGAPVSAATGTKDLDIVFPWSENYLVHGKRYR